MLGPLTISTAMRLITIVVSLQMESGPPSVTYTAAMKHECFPVLPGVVSYADL